MLGSATLSHNPTIFFSWAQWRGSRKIDPIRDQLEEGMDDARLIQMLCEQGGDWKDLLFFRGSAVLYPGYDKSIEELFLAREVSMDHQAPAERTTVAMWVEQALGARQRNPQPSPLS